MIIAGLIEASNLISMSLSIISMLPAMIIAGLIEASHHQATLTANVSYRR